MRQSPRIRSQSSLSVPECRVAPPLHGHNGTDGCFPSCHFFVGGDGENGGGGGGGGWSCCSGVLVVGLLPHQHHSIAFVGLFLHGVVVVKIDTGVRRDCVLHDFATTTKSSGPFRDTRQGIARQRAHPGGGRRPTKKIGGRD